MVVLASVVSERTHEYHQAVLRLAHEFSGTNVAWDVSQHVLDRVWESESSERTSKPSNRAYSSSGSAAAAAIAHYSCQACGYQLHPGWKGTTLRVKRCNQKRSPAKKKTLKRRELRKRKKAALARERNNANVVRHKDHRRNNNNNLASNNNYNNSPNNPETTKGRLHLLRDEVDLGPSILDRNHLVLTCGRCGDRTRLKGLKRELPKLEWKKPPQPPYCAPLKSPSTSASVNGNRNGDVDNLSGNFEHLPRLNNNKNNHNQKKPPFSDTNKWSQRKFFKASANAPENNSARATTESPKKTLLEQRLGMSSKRKKKKNSTPKKSGNLIDFLSSLNDH